MDCHCNYSYKFANLYFHFFNTSILNNSVCGSLEIGYTFYFANTDRNCVIDGTAHSMLPCDMQTYQKLGTGSSSENSNQYYFIQMLPPQNNYLIFNSESNLTLGTNSTNLMQQYPTCGPSQQFRFVPGSSNVCYIYSNSSNLVLTRDYSGCNGLKITLQPYNPSWITQQWSFIATGSILHINNKFNFSIQRKIIIFTDRAPQINVNCSPQISSTKNFITTSMICFIQLYLNLGMRLASLIDFYFSINYVFNNYEKKQRYINTDKH